MVFGILFMVSNFLPTRSIYTTKTCGVSENPTIEASENPMHPRLEKPDRKKQMMSPDLVLISYLNTRAGRSFE